jgi:hypothetical protein
VSTLAVNTITNAAGGNTAQINGMTPTADSLQGFRNRLINGDMRIDQRNAGASVTPTTSGTYTLDRWIAGLSQASKFSVQQSSTAPTGFTNSLLVTSLSAYSVGSSETFLVGQYIEGFNVADLGWGAAGAQTVTLSFWVRSSLTGTFGGAARNSAGDRSYPFSYTVSSANTWEQKSITIAGDTTGTWLKNNGAGLNIIFSLGTGSTLSGTAGAWAGANYLSATGATSVVGTSGATFYITGVQLEAGSVATPFERRPYGTELMLCQRYLPALRTTSEEALGGGYCPNTTLIDVLFSFQVPARVPTTGITTSAANTFLQQNGANAITGVSFLVGGATATYVRFVTSGVVALQANGVRSTGASTFILFTGCEL